METIKPQENQNIFDMALQEYGSIEGLFDLMDDNQINEADSTLTVYNDLTIISTPTKRDIKEFYISRSIKPATGLTNEEVELFEDKRDCEGIGCMEVEHDFIVYRDPETEPETCLEKALYSNTVVESDVLKKSKKR